MFWHVWLALGLPALASVLAASNTPRPFELIVNRNPETLRCTSLTLRQTQVFRSLPEDGYWKNRTIPNGEDRMQFIAASQGDVRERANALCGSPNTWDFQVLVEDTSSSHITENIEKISPQSEAPILEIESLITSGDSKNRVDLVFFSDGYTTEEKQKFLEDAFRLAEDISGNQTFYTVKPLLNFWAAFTPSRESGVGTGGHAKDTVYGLYRDGTELRGVYYAKPEVARAACFSMGTQCDYPILMGNDPLYGGLGGEFTVITPSLANGPLVLRHELGHSVIDVGEEYDGGFAYFGVNAAHSTSIEGIPWAHWLTTPPHVENHGHDHVHGRGAQAPLVPLVDAPKTARVERSVMPMQVYAWTMLNTTSSWTAAFNSSGMYAWALVRFSLSGLPSAKDLRVALDGHNLHWAPRKDIGVDRWHYDIKLDVPLEGGEHTLNFTLMTKEREGEAQLCSVEVLEFGDEDEFVTKPGHYSLYPTFSETNGTSYRPTNEDCLMRIVTTPDFCKSCTEGLWHALLQRVSLIDGLDIGCAPSDPARPDSKLARTLDLQLVPLAHLRDAPVGVEEGLEITWVKNGQEVPAFANRTRVVDDGDSMGSYAVKVRYWTDEVRVDPDGLLEDAAAVVVTTRCG